MKDQNKTKKQLLDEIAKLHQRVDELERLEKKHKETEEALRESEGQFGLVADSLPVLISYIDSQQRYRFNNKAYERWFGHHREEVYGKHLKEVLGEPAYEVIRQYIEKVLSGQQVSFERWVFNKAAEDRYVRAFYVPHFGKEGKVKGSFAFVDDLTEHKRKDEELERYEQSLEKLVNERTEDLRTANKELQQDIDQLKQAEDALRENEEMFRALAETVTSGIAVFQDEKYCYVNPAVTTITGYTQEELLVMHFWDFVHPDFEELVKERGFARQRGEPLPSRYEVKIVNKCGETRWVDVSVTSIKFKGVPAGLVALLDITERKRAEEKVLRQSAVLDAINKVLLETLTCETDEEVACTCLAFAEALTGSKFGFIGEVNQQGRFDTIALSDPGWDECKMPKSNAALMIKGMEIRGFWGKVIKDEQSLIVNIPASHPESVEIPEGHPQLNSFLGVPLKHEGKTFGMIGLANRSPGYDMTDQKDIENLSVAFVEALKRKRAEEALRKSEANLSALIENTNDWICSVDFEYRILTMNRAWRNMFFLAYKIELEEGMNLMVCFPPERRSFWAGVHGRALRGQRFTFEDYYDPEGISIDVNVSVNPIVGENGEITGVSYFIRDITEQKGVQNALRESEARYRALVESQIDLISRYRPDTTLTFVNDAYCQFYGKTREELIGYSFLFMVAPEFHELVLKETENMVKDPRPIGGEYLNYRKDGKGCWIQWVVQSIVDENGRVVELQASGRDITRLKQTEQILRQSEEDYRDLYENAPNGYFSVNAEGQVGRCNRYLVEMLGYKSADEIVGMPVEGLYADTPHGKSKIQQIFQNVRAGGTFHDEELQMEKRDGAPVWTSLTTNAERDDEGQFRWTRSMVVNITERKRMEDLLKTERDLGLALSATSGLNKMLSLCFDAAIRVSGMDSGGIYLVDETSGDLDLVFHKGLSADFVKSVLHHNADSANARLAMAGKPMYTQHEELGLPLSENERNEGLHTIAVIPVKSEDRVTACLINSSHSLDEVSDFTRTALETIATQIGNAIIRAKAEETLRESEANYRELANSISDVFFAMDKDLKYTYWNKASENLLGIPAKDAIGKSLYDFFPQIRGTRAEEVYLEVLKTQQAQSFINKFRIGDKNFIFDISAYPSYRGLSVFVKDITEQKRTEEALLESKANLSALIENTNDWICSVDSKYRILTMNRAWRNMFFFVYKIELEEGVNLMACFPPERRSFWAGVHGRALRGQRFTFEDHYDPEGISIDVNVSVNPIVGENGEITGVSYFIRDITEQKQVERTLRESQELYRSLFEGVPVGLYRTMPSGEILDANQAFVKMLGYLDPSSLLVANFINMYAIRDERKQWENLMEKDGIVRDFEARLRRKDDTVIWIRNTCHAVRNSDGQVLYHEGAIQDITERKWAEEALRESEERYRTLFEESRDVIYITARDGKFIDINKSGLELFAYNKKEIMGLNVQDIYVDPDDRLRFQREIECEGFVRDYEIKFRKKDGTAIDGLVTAIVQRANDGTILGYQGIIRDISGRKRAEEELRSSREQLRALSAHLQSVREEERALIAREIHDELGQELTGLKMDLSWLIKRLPSDQGLLVKKTESMSKLLDNTIQLVRRISTKLRPGVLDDLGLTAAIEWQAQDFRNRTGIECEFNSNVREVDLDQDRSTTVFRILQETLTNVARHASATYVNIFLEEEATSLVLVVEDNGRGITESEASDPKSLGLLGMRERALVFGGQVEIRGTPGRGTAVTLKIPQQK
jgi:PAS domain S-box-containing protein